MTRSPLAGTLSLLLPGPAETALLHVCLGTGRAREAWSTWTRLGGDLDSHRSLLPLVGEGARQAGVALDADVAARFSGARLHEILRLDSIREVTAHLLGRLRAAGLDPVVQQDLALAETVYPEPALRHCHALELLLSRAGLGEAEAVLAGELGCTRQLPVRLFSSPFPRIVPDVDPAGILERAIEAEIGGARVRIPAPEDALLIAIGRAAAGAERRTLAWVCDAAHVIGSAGRLDWDLVVRNAAAWRLEIPIAAMLEWLAGEFAIPIPRAAIERMVQTPARGGRHGRAIEIALDCARADGRAGPAGLLARSSSWRERARVVRWTVAPSMNRLRRTFPDARPAIRPFLYVARPLRYLARTAARSLTPRRFPNAGRGAHVPEAGRAAARSGDRSALAADRASASRRSWGRSRSGRGSRPGR